MARTVNWESRIGRRLRLRDLHVFFAVAQAGAMAKAAAQLGITQPSVSKAVGDLEAALGVRLFDRSPQGVEPTIYGSALLKCGTAVFDELRLGIRNIEFLSDPTVGELRIGSSESLCAAILSPIIHQFLQQYPGVVLEVDTTHSGMFASKLRERSLDLALTQLSGPAHNDTFEDLNLETLLDDRLIIATGMNSRWARRRKIDLAELADEPWILAAPDTWNYKIIEEAFRSRGLAMPKVSVKTVSVHIRTSLLSTGQFIAVFPRSVLHLYGDRFALKVLPIDLPIRPWPAVLATLKNRTVSPVVERFIECAREVAKSIAGKTINKCEVQ
jgi:DNA-binding transcriptional LysR family regulator